MKKLKIQLILIIFGFNILSAQNAFFIEEAKENITNGYLNSRLSKEINTILDVDNYFSASYLDFKDFKSFWFYNLIVAHRRFNFSKDSTEDDYYAKRNKFVKILSSDKILQETIYNCLFPIYKASFIQLTNGESENFLKEIEEALKYVRNFDLTKEMADENKLGFDFMYKKGRTNAFIYRRIKNKDTNKSDCEFWLNKLYKDLKAVRKVKSPEENYILSEKIADKYYRGENYEYYYANYFLRDSVKKDFVYYIKDNNQFKKVAGNIKIREFNKGYINFSIISEQTSNGEYKILFKGLVEDLILTSKKDVQEFLQVSADEFLLKYTDNTTGLYNSNDKTLSDYENLLRRDIREIKADLSWRYGRKAFIIYKDSTFVLLDTDKKSITDFNSRKISEIKPVNYDWDNLKLENVFLIYADNTFELFNLTDKSVYNFSGRHISKIMPVYHNEDAFENKVLLIYNDGLCELFNIENKTGLKISDKKAIALDRVEIYISKFQHGFFYVNYADNSSDFLFFPQKDKMQKNGFKNKFEYFSSEYSLEVFLLKLKSGEQHLVLRNEDSLNFIKLNSEYDFITPTTNNGEFVIKLKSGEKYLLKNSTLIKLPDDFGDIYTVWKNNIIYRKILDDKNFKNIAYTLKGKKIELPDFVDFLLPGTDSDFIMFGEKDGERTLFTIYDSTFRKKGETKYLIEIVYSIDPENFEETLIYSDNFDKDEKTIIISAAVKNKNGIDTVYRSLLDSNGNILIPERWPEIQRISILGANNDYYVVTEAESKKKAIFNAKGEQMTKFEFEDVIGYNAVFSAILNGEFVFLDKGGKMTDKADLTLTKKIEGSEIYLLCYENGRTNFIVDKNSSKISKTYFSLVPNKIVTFNPETFEETITEIKEELDKKDENFLIFKNVIYNNKIINRQKVLLNENGKIIIDKNTERIIIPGAEHNLYKVSESSFFKTEPDLSYGPEGRFALYNYKGKALSKFIYNSISDPDENGNMQADRNGKNVTIDKNGKEINK